MVLLLIHFSYLNPLMAVYYIFLQNSIIYFGADKLVRLLLKNYSTTLEN